MRRLSLVPLISIAVLLIVLLVILATCQNRPSVPKPAPTKAGATAPATRLTTSTAAPATTRGTATTGPGVTALGPSVAEATGTLPATAVPRPPDASVTAAASAPSTIAAITKAPSGTTTGAPGPAAGVAATPAAGSPTPSPSAQPLGASTAPGAPATSPAGQRPGPTATPVPPAGAPASAPIAPAAAEGAACVALDSSLEVTASATQVKVGQTVSFTAQFRNNGCGQVANPQYHLITSGPAWPAPLVPGNPPTLSHTAGVSYGEADAAAFALRASNPGQTTVTLSAVFQFRQDSTGASTWNVVAAQPVQITVTR